MVESVNEVVNKSTNRQLTKSATKSATKSLRRTNFETGIDSDIPPESIESSEGVPIEKALNQLISEMRLLGYRERTLYDYVYHMTRYMTITGVLYLEEMDKLSLLEFINYNDVSPSTKRIRSKVMKAILNRWLREGLLEINFWKDIRIKVDEDVKIGTSPEEMYKLLKALDLNDFVQLRDACIFLLMWETGVRIGTMSRMRGDIIDFKEQVIHFDGSTMKNHRRLSLPISARLVKMLRSLIRVNKDVRAYNDVVSDNIFITIEGRPMSAKAFSKRVLRYRAVTGLENISPHAIRRGFGKRLLDKGVNVAVISRALNHSSIETTTRYLHIDNQEVIDILRTLM